MQDRAQLIEQITSAFAAVKFPGDWCLRDSNEGNEPYRVERAFKGKDDWHALDPAFLDQAPDGMSSALSFFSDEAFHFYLPAYMIADVRDQLACVTPAFHLTHGLDDSSRDRCVNPRRYGGRTWFDVARFRFSMFGREEAAAITAYLLFTGEREEFDRDRIDEALRNYWYERAGLR